MKTRSIAKMPKAVCAHCKELRVTQHRGLCWRCYEDKDVRPLYPTKERKAHYGPACRHCAVKPCNRPLGLCWSCYYNPAVKDQYASTCPAGMRGVFDHVSGVRPLPEPTKAVPGTTDKVNVMMERAEKGFALHHPDDAVRDDAEVPMLADGGDDAAEVA